MKVLTSKPNYVFLLLDCGHVKWHYKYGRKYSQRCKECYEINLATTARRLGLKLLPGKVVLKHYQTRYYQCLNCNKTVEVYTSTVYNLTAKCRCNRINL